MLWTSRGYSSAVIAAGVPISIRGGTVHVPVWAAVVSDADLPMADATELLRAARLRPEVQRALADLDGLPVDLIAPTVRALAGV